MVSPLIIAEYKLQADKPMSQLPHNLTLTNEQIKLFCQKWQVTVEKIKYDYDKSDKIVR